MDPFTEDTPVPGRVAWDIQRIVHDLTQDRDYIVQWWSVWRDPRPLLDALQTSWAQWSASDLLGLSLSQLALSDAFYHTRGQTWQWASHTEEMPFAFEERLDHEIALLQRSACAALPVLGPVPSPPSPPAGPPAWWGSLRRPPVEDPWIDQDSEEIFKRQ